MNKQINEQQTVLNQLCHKIRKYCEQGEFVKSEILVNEAMAQYPDAPEPHNLRGIILVQTNQRDKAMQHFRAAWDLAPDYVPAQENLKLVSSRGTFAKMLFGDEKLPSASENFYQLLHSGLCAYVF